MHVAIVGAGPAGLGAARHCAELGRVTVLERAAALGGIWAAGEAGPVYRDLHTNLPKELMAFPDFPFPESDRSFVHHSEVRTYLEQYAAHFNLEKHIVFCTEVVEVRVERRGDPGSGWRLRLRDLQSGAEREIRADMVILTGVREQVPRLPERLAAQFTGPQCHSSQYRHAHLPHYTGGRVLVVGCSLSGADIAAELSTTAARVLVSAERGAAPIRNFFTGNIERVAAIDRISGRRVELRDGTRQEVDSIVWCTGYSKDPASILHPDCGLEVLHDGYVVHPLYLHTINTRQPTMAVLHLTTGNVPFLQIDMQVRCFLALHRTNTLPSSEAMLTWLAEDAAWRASLQLAPRHRHKLQAGTRLLHWAGYMASLARAAGLRPPAPVHGHMFLYTLCLVKLRGLPFARTVRFTLSEDKASFSVTPNIFAVNILYWLGRILMYFGVIK